MKTATFAAGCFWGVEEAFITSRRALRTRVGYTGGHIPDPTYEMVCSGTTGHAEAVEVTYDPANTNYKDLLNIFWGIHDPTTLNRQGPDIGEQYRSVIFYHDTEQFNTAKESLKSQQSTLSKNIVTQLLPASKFYPAEEYHQKYMKKCSFRNTFK